MKTKTAMRDREYKMGDVLNGKVFWSYDKRFPNSQYWVTKEQFKRWRGYDDLWSVYFLPNENYYGATNRILARMREHKKKKRDTTGYIIVKQFDNKKDAFDYESKLQISKNSNGYIYNKKWRDTQREKIIKNGEIQLYSKTRKPIICVTTGEVFKGVRDCERKLNLSTGNLSKHLKGDKNYNIINNLKFKYNV